MARAVRRGEPWRAEVGHERRPEVVLTRSDSSTLATASPSPAAPVPVDPIGLDRGSVVHSDDLRMIQGTRAPRPVGRVRLPAQLHLGDFPRSRRLGHVGDDVRRKVCSATSDALGC